MWLFSRFVNNPGEDEHIYSIGRIIQSQEAWNQDEPATSPTRMGARDFHLQWRLLFDQSASVIHHWGLLGPGFAESW